MRKQLRSRISVSPYITPEGQRQLSEELSYLWKVKRPQVTQAVAEAAAMGDRSENAEYLAKALQIDSAFVSHKEIERVGSVDRTPDDASKFFGAWVEVETATVMLSISHWVPMVRC
jgi:transcription elongation factor GreB